MAKRSKQAAAAAPPPDVRVSEQADWFAWFTARKVYWQISLLLVVATWLVYAQTLGFAFLDWGDAAALTDNVIVQTGWSVVGLRYAFENYQISGWQPVTWLSHMTDFALLGLDAGSHHATNVVFHMLSALLVFGMLVEFTGARWRAGLVALVFAVHPLQVEAVAWLSGRATLAGGLFGLAGAWAWLKSAEGKRRWYAAAIGLLLLAVMSNTALGGIVVGYLALEWWLRQGRVRWLPALPLLAIGGVALGIWTWTSFQSGGVAIPPFSVRLGNALAALASLAGAAFWPAKLAAFYPMPAKTPAAQMGAGIAVLVVPTVVALLLARRRPYLLAGWVWFLATLLPVSGLIPIGALARADRFMYLPLVGLLICVVWGLHALMGKLETSAVPVVVAVMAVAVLTWSAWAQTSYWQGDIPLFQQALRVTGDANRVAHSQIGATLVRLNQVEYALDHLKKAIDLDPNFAPSYRRLAEALFKRELNSAALTNIEKAISLDPASAQLYADRGRILRASDRLEEAYESFAKALQLGLDLTGRMDALFQQGLIRSKQMKYPEAISLFEQALELDPYFYLARKNLAFTYLRAEKYFEASREFDLLARTNPDDQDVVKAVRFLKQRIK
jgi:tetratricopeptide (TPR) repeat protein